MNVIAEWFRRLAYLLNRSRHDAALRAEMESHRAMMADSGTLRQRAVASPGRPRRLGLALA